MSEWISEEEWNDGYWLEAADRIHVIQENIQSHLVDHPAIIKADVQEDIDMAMECLQRAYNLVGSNL